MSDSDKIKLTVLPTETMHADPTWLLINSANMATKDQPVKQKDWVEVPTHVVQRQFGHSTKELIQIIRARSSRLLPRK
jgi:N-acyl homoserine lactone hydrolase